MTKEEDYCIICGKDVFEDPKKCCPHVVWSDRWK